MKISRVLRTSAAFVLLLAAEACYQRVKTSTHADVAGAALDRRELAEETISHWSNYSALTAKRLIEEYGVPDEVHADRLVWINNSPWRRTVVRNERGIAATGVADQDIVEQSVDYRLDPKRAADVAAFDDRVVFNPRSGQLSARAGKEAYNFLRLNLADDIAHGRMRPEEARNSYARLVTFEQAGKTSPYMLGLRFTPDAP
ncbi:MAG: hypothetical protein ACHQ2Z_01280 [Elusimicrobiota bacterium]